MINVNTNIPSMVAARILNTQSNRLNVSLVRLGTGLRINTGKDDPAGLIASELLRAERTAISVHKMQDLVLAQSGYYKAYDMSKERPEDNVAARGTEALIEAIDEVLAAGATVVDVEARDDD